MASIFKNQVLKHLSKFAKNLSPDKLHLSTLKGHGELRNLELNEKVLTELLELPAWLCLTKATCNYVTLQSLDEVVVEMKTCEDLRPPTPMTNEASYKSGGKYGFSDRVIDGMTVVVNSVIINFSSPAFQASFQLSRVVLESYCPFFKKKDLRLSRIKESDRGEILLFKRLDWQVLRIEAKSSDNHANGLSGHIPLTPLRLITNQGCYCNVIGSRLIFVLDDLLWVLTDAQLVAALHFVQSLSGLVQKATELTQKQKAKQKLEQQPDKHAYSSHSKSSTPLCPAFYRHDVVETSYHVLCSRIDLHLCDDMDPKDGRSQHTNLKSGGALQVSLDKLIMDYYPYHRAFSSREHWLHYSEPSSSRSTWVQQLLALFHEKLQSKVDVNATGESVYPKESPKHNISPSADMNVTDSPTTPDDKPLLTRKASTISNSSGTLTPDVSRKSISGLSRKSSLQWNYRYLMSSCFVLRLEDIVAYKVSTSTSSRTRAIEKFLIYNKSAHMPSDIKTIHLEQTSYYLPGEIDFPVAQQLIGGPRLIVLISVFMIWGTEMSLKLGATEAPSFVNIRVEALLPQIVIPSDANSPTQPDRPRTLQLQSSRTIATNCRLGDHTTRSDLNECLETFSSAEMFSNTSKFPWRKDKKPLANAFFDHVLGKETDSKNLALKGVLSEATDVWSIYLDPFWAEFTVCESGRTRLQPFIDPLPITLWFYSSQKPQEVLRTSLNKSDPDNFKMCLPNLQSYDCQNHIAPTDAVSTSFSNISNLNNNENENEADVYLLININSLVNVQLSHFQYLFVLRAADIITDMMENLEVDTSTIIKNKPVLSVCTSAWIPQIELSLVLRNLNQMSATSDSVDLASLQEDCSSTSDIPHNFRQKILQSKSSLSVGECDVPDKKPNQETLCSSILDDCCLENGLPKSCSDSLLNCHSSGSSQGINTPIQEAQPSIATESIHRGFHSGTSAMKRGLCSLVASIDSALTKSDPFSSIDADIASFPDDDTVSIRSDVSSDMDQFVLVNQDGSLEDEFFQHARPEIGIDVASKMRENSIISNYTLNSEKKKEMVSITIFKFGKVGFVSHSKLDTSLLLHCGQIETKEEAAISWENFQNNFSTSKLI
ncbi:UHRF1-binding protein 1-like [Trichonephila clavipes]|nr:UHRF1-binding protein 1-like [Trichonephila clavipes]